jgi:hypothetical protein
VKANSANKGSKIGPRGRAQFAPRDDPRAVKARCTRTHLVVALADGRLLQVPIAWFDRLRTAPAKALGNVQICFGGRGIRLPDADEDISVERLLMPACPECLERTWAEHRKPQHDEASLPQAL